MRSSVPKVSVWILESYIIFDVESLKVLKALPGKRTRSTAILEDADVHGADVKLIATFSRHEVDVLLWHRHHSHDLLLIHDVAGVLRFRRVLVVTLWI